MQPVGKEPLRLHCWLMKKLTASAVDGVIFRPFRKTVSKMHQEITEAPGKNARIAAKGEGKGSGAREAVTSLPKSPRHT